MAKIKAKIKKFILFVYGTLRKRGHLYEKYQIINQKFIGFGKIQGKLFVNGAGVPFCVMSQAHQTVGEVYECNSEILPELNYLEQGYKPILTDCILDNGQSINVLVYRCPYTLVQLQEDDYFTGVKDGDYIKYLIRKGHLQR